MTKRYFTESKKDVMPSFFSNLKKDDLILIGIILILLGDGCEDKELIIMLALLFISDKTNITDKLFGN